MPTPTEWEAIRLANSLPDEPVEKFGLKAAVETVVTQSGGGGGGLNQAQVDARVTAGIAAWVDVAPGALDTLAEIATALGDDQTAIDGLTSAIAGKADAAHTHAQADVTGLPAALDGKQAVGSYAASSHNHTASAITDFGTAADARIAAASVNALADVTVTSPSVGQVLKWNGTAWVNDADATGGGGSDPWTVVKLAADFITSSATAVNVTGLAFAPAANQTYVIEGILLFRTATTTVGARPGCSWPSGMSDGAIRIDVTSAAGTQVVANGNIAAAVLAPVGGLPTTTGSFPGLVSCLLLAGAAPSGNFQVQLASETAATNVTMKAGSFIRYRTI